MAEEIQRESITPTVRLTPMQNAFVESLVEDNQPNKWRQRKYLKSIAVGVGYSPQAVDKLITERPDVWTAANYLINERPITIFVDQNATGRAVTGDPDENRQPGEELASPRQELFCKELVSDPNFNKKKASIRAGYQNADYGTTLYRIPKIQKRIDELREERNKRLKSDADDVLQKLMLISNTNIIDFVRRWDGNAVEFEDSNMIPRDILYGVSQIKQTITGVGRNQTENFTLKLRDNIKALALLAKHHGLLDQMSSIDPEEFAKAAREAAADLGTKVPGGVI